MKPSPLQKQLNQYLQLRRSLGFKLVREGMWLPGFVRSLEQSGKIHITSEHALVWAMGVKSPPPPSWPRRLSMVRKFAQYVHAQDPRHQMPGRELAPPERSHRMEPYIYSDSDVRKLLDAAQDKSCHPVDYTLLGLLAATGMRVGEAINLDRLDFDSIQGILTIRRGKLGKSRQIVLHPTTTRALEHYARRRDREIRRPMSPAFLLSQGGKRLIYQNVHFRFFNLVNRAGLGHVKPHRPRIHDLRHTFAIRVLVGWYRAGLETSPRLPALSTYLGHVSPSSTYWYLTATPELLQLACKRLEAASGGQS